MKENELANNSKSKNSYDNERKAEQYLDLLEKVVKEFQNSGESEEELKQVAYIGLLNAINLYKSPKSITFEEYAQHLIAGEIRHFIREKHKKIKIPSWLKMMNRFINRIIVTYRKQFNRFPDFKELSRMLNLSPEGLKEALKARESVHKVSIDKNRRVMDIKEPPDYAKIKKEMKRKENG